MTTKKRIGFYTDATGVGGADIVLRQYLKILDHDEYDCILFCRHAYDIDKIFERPYPFKVVYIDNPLATNQSPLETAPQSLEKRPLPQKKSILKETIKALKYGVFFNRESRRLKKILAPHQLDILHYNDVVREPGILGARLAGVKKTIGTYHIFPLKLEGSWPMRTVSHWIESRVYKNLDKQIVVSEAAKEGWEKRLRLKTSTLQTVHNSIDLDDFPLDKPTESIREQQALNNEHFVIGCLARLHSLKGQNYLIEAMPEILSAHPNARLLLVGEGPERAAYEALIKQLDLEASVIITGYVENKNDYLQTFDLFALASFGAEAFGLVLLEAMAYSKACIVSDFSGMKEVIDDGKTGFVFEQKNPHAIANKVIALINAPEKRLQFGKNGRQRLERHFTEDRFAKSMNLIYSS